MDTKLQIQPQKLGGSIQIMPSKSMSHRMAIGAALSGPGSVVKNIGLSQDIHVTVEALQALGYPICFSGTSLQYNANTPINPSGQKGIHINCHESGSSIRFLIPLALCLNPGGQIRFTGTPRLLERPMTVYKDLFAQKNILFTHTPEEILVQGSLKPGEFHLRGDVSSQFISGLLFALPLLDGDSILTITTPLESKGYVDLTIEALGIFGIQILWEGEQKLVIKGNQRYVPTVASVEGDYSHAAFHLTAGLLGKGICCKGLKSNSAQGDRAIIPVLEQMGGQIVLSEENNRMTAFAHPSPLHPATIDASQIPDLVPILSVAACAASGKTIIHNAARLRIKESDRLHAMAEELNKLGGHVAETGDGLVIHSNGVLKGGSCQSHNDHRIAMSLAVASVLCTEPILLAGYESVKKSAPDFWDEFQSLEGRIKILAI